MIHTALPHLSPERITQMIHLATSHAQEARNLSWYQAMTLKSRRFFYGLSASAVTVSCIGAFWLAPLLAPVNDAATQEIGVSEYIMQDFLEEIS